MKRPSTLNHLSSAIMIEALMHGPVSVVDISDETGVSYTTTRRYIATLFARGLIHVAAWHEDTRGRRTLRAYKLGKGRNAPRPAPRTHAERQSRHRERAKALQQAMQAMVA
jgi:predicted ArsR family transcriptional regulator